MSKFVVRITIVSVAAYLVLCYFSEVAFGVQIWFQDYNLLFELCVCLCVSKQGVYHCRFIKYTAYGILLSDALVCFDNHFDIFPINFMVFAPAITIAVGLATTTALAIRHYHRVRKIKHKWNKTSAIANPQSYKNSEESSSKEYEESTKATTAPKRKPTEYSLGSTQKARASSTSIQRSTMTMR